MRFTRWSSLATRDFAQIDAYLSKIDGDIADAFNDSVLLACDFLLDHSGAGPVIRARTRKWPVRNSDYVLLYRIVEDGILIVRVHHARENWREPA